MGLEAGSGILTHGSNVSSHPDLYWYPDLPGSSNWAFFFSKRRTFAVSETRVVFVVVVVVVVVVANSLIEQSDFTIDS